MDSPKFQKIRYIIAFEEAIIILEIPSIILETLLFNIKENQKLLVINADNDVVAYGDEYTLRKRIAHCLDYLVTSIFLNKRHQIEVHISNEL